MGGFAWVTLATNDSYSLGALVLANSLRRVNTAHQLVVLITPSVTEAMRTQLSAVFNVVKLVDVLDSQDADNLALLARPELGITFTKLHCWRLTEFEKCVFLDADTLVLQNSDELFEREELSAAPDAGWPDCFNSGVFVYRPSNDTFKSLIEFALVHGSFDGGDQGLLNLYFSDWATKDIKKHLPFVYNMCSTATYSYLPAFKQFGKGLKIVHFIGAAKPWLQPFNTETGLARVSGESQHVVQFVQLWWDLFCTTVHPSLSTEMAGLAGALASVSLGIPLSEEQTALTEHMRRQGWEQGNIDYMGKDSFANIWQKICDTLGTTSSPAEEAPAPVAPVAAPVYVSSVEISPEGPVDTSPPASYAPVSAPKPVVASDNETAFKASQAETAAVIPEPKSPSVTEVVSLEPRVSSTTAADTSASAISAESPSAASPSVTPATPTEVTVSSVISSEAPVKTSLADSVPVVASPVEPLTTSSQIPVTPAPVTVAPVQSVPVATEVVTIPSGIPVPQEAPVTPQETLPLVPTEVIALLPTEAKPTAVVTKETPTVLKEEPAIVLTGVPVADAIDTPSPTLSSTPGPVSLSQILTQPLDPLSLPTSLVTDVPNNPSVVSTQAEVPAPVVSPQAEVPTPVFSPQAEVPTPVDSPQAEVPTPVVSPQAEVPVSVASPQAEVPTPVDSPQAEVPVSVSSPQAEVPAPVVSPKAEGPTPVVSPQAEGPTPVVSPKAAVPAPVVSPQAEVPASVVSPQAEVPAPVVSPQAKVPASVVSPQAEVPASVVSPQAEGPAPMSPQTIVPSTPTDAKTTAPLIPQVTASEMITPASSPLSDVLVSQPLNLLTKIISTVTTQPGTPTVTEPTPPTSPPAVPIESPLATKLLVEAEIPGTPPAGACSSEPSLATTPADEPPIPPKRKGGSKSQTSQNQKGGKQGKGKK